MKRFYEFFERLERISHMIENMSTGAPKQLASKIGVSERQVYNDINFLKEEFNAPIVFNRNINSYEFEDKSFRLVFKEVKELISVEKIDNN